MASIEGRTLTELIEGYPPAIKAWIESLHLPVDEAYEINWQRDVHPIAILPSQLVTNIPDKQVRMSVSYAGGPLIQSRSFVETDEGYQTVESATKKK